MKRSTFFSAIAALFTGLSAKAQTIITPCQPRLQWGNPPPPNCNGQCPNPTCTYIAPPFPRLPDRAPNGYQDWEVYDREHAWPKGRIVQTLVAASTDSYAEARLNRCPKCNTAFWQDPS